MTKKRTYEKARLVNLSVANAAGQCFFGSGYETTLCNPVGGSNSNGCTAGNAAGVVCTVGNGVEG